MFNVWNVYISKYHRAELLQCRRRHEDRCRSGKDHYSLWGDQMDDRERRLCSVAIIKRHRKREYAWNNFHLSRIALSCRRWAAAAPKRRESTDNNCNSLLLLLGPFYENRKVDIIGRENENIAIAAVKYQMHARSYRIGRSESERFCRDEEEKYRNPQHFHSIYSTAGYANLGRRSCWITFSLSASLAANKFTFLSRFCKWPHRRTRRNESCILYVLYGQEKRLESLRK